MSMRRILMLFFVLSILAVFSVQAFALEVLGGAAINDRDYTVDGRARLWFSSGVGVDATGYPPESITVLNTTGTREVRPFFGVGVVKQSDGWQFSTGMFELALGLEVDISFIMPDFHASIEYRASIHEQYVSLSVMYNISSLFDFSRSYSPEDLDLLARLISAESRGEPFEGQVAVGAVVLNRLKSPEFPDTIRDVIYQEGQFTSVANGAINAPPAESSIAAARAALAGEDPSLGALYFCNPNLSSESGLKFMSTRTPTTTIGRHVFYK